jgi:hypothetical protein
MKIRLSAAALAALAALAGCDDDGPTFTTTGPQAYVRYVNGSPDAPPLTARLVDQVDNMFAWDRVGFRSHSGLHIPVNAGTRRLRVFLANSNNIGDVSTVVLDTTVELQARTYYTFVQSGAVLPRRGEPGNTARVDVFVDTLPDAATIANNRMQVRVYHVAPAAPAVDVVLRKATAAADSAVQATITNLAPLRRSAYQTVETVRGADTASLYRITVRPTGDAAAAPLVNARPSVPGQAYQAASIDGGPERQAQGGVRINRSVLSAFIFPAAVAGSPAASSSNGTPGVLVVPDLIPPSPTP